MPDISSSLFWIAGGMLLTDPVMPVAVSASIPYAHYVFAITGALLVVLVGKWLGSRRTPPKAVELSAEAVNPKP
ncbi:hypothetical protein [Rhodoferax sp.]|uniref:hypothetical protein n=1 Tax=Rhodoferax sp. TaxID=50421 RepID=UPI0019F4C82A|nr:hypothetical protein [Rhodoferax sp.]MBE0473474.1 hypothetical protein [Rhodoferax sp.]